MSPAGPALRMSPHAGAGSRSSSSGPVTCPMAARKRSTSSGRVQVWVSPSGPTRCSASAASQTLPVSRSITRPRMTKPLLQYDMVAPSGCTCVSSAQAWTYLATQSSPLPVSWKKSPLIPELWHSRCRRDTCRVTSGSATRKSGSTSTTRVSTLASPWSTSRCGTVVV
jgi:hypothetical protein